MTQLRQRMIDDLRVRNYAPATIQRYVECVAAFARFFGRCPSRLGPEEIRQFQVHLTVAKKLSFTTLNQTVCALRFLYRVTLRAQFPIDLIPFSRRERKLPVVLSRDEVTALLGAASLPKHNCILATFYSTGIRLSELQTLQTSAVDASRKVIRVDGPEEGISQWKSSQAGYQRAVKLLRREKRKIKRRLQRQGRSDSGAVLGRESVRYDVADRTRAVSAGGLGVASQLVSQVGLDAAINDNVHVLKRHAPYHESDHILTIAYNLLTGGTCLEDVESMRTDAVTLDALGASSIPDPTTLGDFCRRFTEDDIVSLMDVINEVRRKVWSQQPDEFFEEATIEADGTVVGVDGKCTEGIGMTYKGIIGYQPLLISLAETEEPLFIVNRPGNVNSCLGATAWYDTSIQLVRSAGFRKVTLRGDTAFSQTSELDRWTEDGVRCVLGFRACRQVIDKAYEEPGAWKKLDRPARYTVATEPRSKQPDYRQQLVKEKGYLNLRLQCEEIKEIRHTPTAAKGEYRVIVLRKNITQERGEEALADDVRYFAYITNDWETPAADLVCHANKRCNQEKLIETLKNQVHALRMPVGSLLSNWAYNVMASLAYSISRWLRLLLPEKGRWATQHRQEKQAVLKLSFCSFLNRLMFIPAQIVKGARRVTYRLLAWKPYAHLLLRLSKQLSKPLRC